MKEKHYLVYKITNLINGKIYKGQHTTSNIDDGYMGSSKPLDEAINKYGIDNFKKEILFDYETFDEMDTKEKELVNEDFVARKDTYNITIGGGNGFYYINNNKLNNSSGQNITGSLKHLESLKDPEYEKDFKRKASDGFKKYIEVNGGGSFTGKEHTVETKQKMSESHKGKHIGVKNSQYGTMWITNGLENKKIKKDSDIPINWKKGRKI